MMKGKKSVLALACAIVIASMAGCGGSDDVATSNNGGIPAPAPAASLVSKNSNPTSGDGVIAITSIKVEDAGFKSSITPKNRVTVRGTSGGLNHEVKIYINDADCTFYNISHDWGKSPFEQLGRDPQDGLTYLTEDRLKDKQKIGSTLGLDPANNTITFDDLILDVNAPNNKISTLKGSVQPSVKVCASAKAPGN